MPSIPVCLHIPHWSSDLPKGASFSRLEEVSSLTDWYTNELFFFPGAARIEFPYSRLLVDVERFRDDDKEVMAPLGMGAVYSGGVVLGVSSDRECLLSRYYDPHHDRLNEWARASLEENGAALLIDCHSFCSTPLSWEDKSLPRPHLCFGTNIEHTPGLLIASLSRSASKLGLCHAVNCPYVGTMVPSRFSGDPRLSAVMIEVNKSLYMDETTLAKLPSFRGMQGKLREVMANLIETWEQNRIESSRFLGKGHLQFRRCMI